LPALRFGLRFRVVATLAKALDIFVVVAPAFLERNDMVAYRCGLDEPLAFARGA